MRFLWAILLGKTIASFIRFLKIGGGSAAPGLYALKLDPNLVSKLSSKIPQNIVITGTNGKTTTSRMMAHFAKASGLKVIKNQTGSNLERGIASTLISYIHLGGVLGRHLRYNLGIWELDEAAFNSVAPKLNPKIVVFLNVFRDQLDRYGEIDTVVKKWSDTLKKLPKETLVLINGDDANTRKLKQYFKGKVYQFGVKDYKIVGEGIFHQKEKENLDFEAKNVKLNGLKGSSFYLQSSTFRLPINLPLPGIYHIYDALAALACASLLNLPIHRLADTLTYFKPAFGRMEKIYLNPRSHRTPTSEVGYIFLIKNPAGATQVFQTLAPQIKKEDKLLLALNDNLADGTDVSWIWDGDFENLQTTNYKLQTVCSGTRAYDLAVRLKYAGFDSKSITAESELENALKQARKGLKGRLFILPTYTAMLELQGILTKSGIKKHYWEEDEKVKS
ncbi:DUF1727 domain-containing protein [Candidatus Daviesbacteria bacterium]|nr:DUF1727 domain-containing protein [Candidatus Daviesbacteria bacterium]